MRAGLLVIGGGPAGHTAAVAYRDAGGSDAVQIISDDSTRPYARPPLSKQYLRGETESVDLPIEDDSFYRDRDIELLLDEAVVGLEATTRMVRTSRRTELGFDHCVIATGAEPAALDVPGADDPAVLQLRWLHQAAALRSAAERADRAVVIGSGFIGCEAAASLAARGLEVTLVTTEAGPQLARLGSGASDRIERWLVGAGVRMVPEASVSRIIGGRTVVLADGRRFMADLLLAATGVTPRSELAADAGLRVRDGRIVADRHLQTSAAGIYVAGDVALAQHATAGRELSVEHWGDALAMGEVAGRNAAGHPATWSSVPGFWSEIGGHQLKYAAWGDGYDEARLVEHGPDAFTVWYATAGRAVGVLTYHADADYEQGRSLIELGRPLP